MDYQNGHRPNLKNLEEPLQYFLCVCARAVVFSFDYYADCLVGIGKETSGSK